MNVPAGRRRVVVTGLGAVTAIGVGAPEFGAGLRAGRDAARPVSSPALKDFGHANACEVGEFDPSPWLRTVDPATVGRAAGFGLAAARMATGGVPAEVLAGRPSVVAMGTAYGEAATDLDRLTEQEIAGGPAGMDPALARRMSAGRLATAVARELGLRDTEAVTLPTACAAGNYAIGYGLDAIRTGDADLAVCGGADALCRKTMAGFTRLGAMDPDRCRPFDSGRAGMLAGEGAAVLLLEELEHALARGADIHAEVLGYGLSCDAEHPVAPAVDGVARGMRRALRDSGVEPSTVDLISAHGTATQANDLAEARAIHEVFADGPPRTVGLKSMLGHTLGASAALGAVGCVLAIEGGFAPPTINHRETDPECDLDCVPNAAVEADLRVVQSNALAFGGNNAIVLFGRYPA
ncbi:3-oxoacyl-ACP synthase [Actinophytocola xinjiangensis]|uniref:3-oxoacyl-ACP synthase n=1 Tax=Actinophytocola xinjiangensis TaxID=485602 RepID=A0A7Z0WRJ6_9PSEU|nr:3-oxoacyl-ACP synthase [Actinophytocola xinjiangensis]